MAEKELVSVEESAALEGKESASVGEKESASVEVKKSAALEGKESAALEGKESAAVAGESSWQPAQSSLASFILNVDRAKPMVNYNSQEGAAEAMARATAALKHLLGNAENEIPEDADDPEQNEDR